MSVDLPEDVIGELMGILSVAVSVERMVKDAREARRDARDLATFDRQLLAEAREIFYDEESVAAFMAEVRA